MYGTCSFFVDVVLDVLATGRAFLLLVGQGQSSVAVLTEDVSAPSDMYRFLAYEFKATGASVFLVQCLRHLHKLGSDVRR